MSTKSLENSVFKKKTMKELTNCLFILDSIIVEAS